MTKTWNTISYSELGEENSSPVFWGHGWGQSHAAFLPLAQSFPRGVRHVLMDFPGFGNSAPPPEAWSSVEYADLIAAFIRETANGKVIWVGHSFGGRIGLHLAARYPELIRGLVIIAGAGLKRRRPLWRRLYMGLRVRLFKLLKCLAPQGNMRERLYALFGSRDYQSAGTLRGTIVRVINEDLSDIAAQILCPTLLLYGTQDTETPPEIGERLAALIPGSKLILMDGQNHYSVLNEGRHETALHLKAFFASPDLT